LSYFRKFKCGIFFKVIQCSSHIGPKF
jgi:hypothetical protein